LGSTFSLSGKVQVSSRWGKNTYGHSVTHSFLHTSHLHILIKRDNIRINIKVNLAPTYRPLIVFVEAKTIIYITKEPFLFAV